MTRRSFPIVLTQLVATTAWVIHQHTRPPLVRCRAAPIEQDPLWSALENSSSRTEAEVALSNLEEAGLVKGWNSAKLQPRYGVSIEQLKTTTRTNDIADAFGINGGQQVEKIAAFMVGVVATAALSGVYAQQNLTFLPDIWRFVVTLALCFAPYGAIALGIAQPEAFQRFLTVLYARYLPAYRARLARHEAGHVLVGYLLGLPLAKISVNPAAAAVTFYDTRDELSAVMGGAPVARPRGYVSSSAPLEAIAIVSLAGIMSEVEEYGDAEGGAADLLQLQQVYDTTNMNSEDQQLTSRWAALQAHLLLKRNAVALESLVEAFMKENDVTPSVATCVRAIERGLLLPEDDLSGLRIRNRIEPGPVEGLLVRAPRPADWDQVAVVYDRSTAPWWVPQWTPEDVPYLALATTTLFVIYAVNGGIKLH